ncbi:MAG: hypothetical protein V4543_12640 [Bacteroidota bacterium]
MRKIVFTTFLALAAPALLMSAYGQAKISFNGTARSFLRNNSIGGKRLEGDSSTTKSLNGGYTLFDWGINIRPNKETEITGVMRMRNEFGGFYGGGVTVGIRQLTAKGTIAKVIKYQVGDVFLKQTPYTLWNNAEEGRINEAEVFNLPRQVVYYENYYKPGNLWHMQGLQTEAGLNLGSFIKQATINGFLTRNAPTDYSYTNQQLIGGGRLRLMQSENFTLGGNYIRLFDLPNNTPQKGRIINEVYTGNFVTEINSGSNRYFITGEAGVSRLAFPGYTGYINIPGDSLKNRNDGFGDFGAGVDFKELGLTLKANYRQVGANFFSPGAQTKRINFDSTGQFYRYLGNGSERAIRNVTTMDLLRDETLYNQRFSTRLGTTNPLLSNVTPYGAATPNRAGITVEALLKRETFDLQAAGSFLGEMVGIGTEEKRSYTQIRGSGNFHFGKMAGWKKHLDVTLGYQNESTSRSGVGAEVVDLKTSLIDAGLNIEIANKFDLLAGAKIVSGKGNEVLEIRDNYNRLDIYDANTLRAYNVDMTQSMYAFGFNYRFTPTINLTAQGQYFDLSDNTNSNLGYNMTQLFFLFNMHF